MPNVVTPGELDDWLKYKEWDVLDKIDGKITARYRDVVELSIQPNEILYEVNIEAIGDASDSMEEITHDPLRTLVEFVGTGVGEEFLHKMTSVKPSEVSKELKVIAARVASEQLGPRTTVKILRRLATAVSLARFNPQGARTAESPSEFEKTSIETLFKRMKEKGWNVKESDSKLIVDIGGQFKGEIIVDVVMWDYEIGVIGNKKLRKAERTDNPIRDITKFMKQRKVDDLLREAREKGEKSKDAPTVAPGSKGKKNPASGKKNPFEGPVDPEHDPFA